MYVQLAKIKKTRKFLKTAGKIQKFLKVLEISKIVKLKFYTSLDQTKCI